MNLKILLGFLLVITCLLASFTQACEHEIDITGSDMTIAIGETASFCVSISCDQECSSFTYSWSDPDGGTDSGTIAAGSSLCYDYTPSTAGEHEVEIDAASASAGTSSIGGLICDLLKSFIAKTVKVASLTPDVGTEVDEDDADTKKYLVPKATSGNVTVTAVSFPNITVEADLPSSWSLSGGSGSGKLSRTVDRTATGTTEITCTAGTSEKKVKIVVIDGLTINPDTSTLAFGETQDFKAYTVDAAGTGIDDITSSTTFDISPTTGGTFSSATLTAGSTAGTYTVTATYGTETVDATVDVIDGFSVIPNPCYMSICIKKDIEAWTVDASGNAIEVTDDTSFITTKGTFSDNNSLWVSLSEGASSSVGADTITASYASEPDATAALTVVDTEMTSTIGANEHFLVYTGNYPTLTGTSHPDAGNPIHGDEPTVSITYAGTPSGGTYKWVADDETGCGMLEIDGSSTSATVKLRGARASTTASDAYMTISYTLNGFTVEDYLAITVSKPNSVTLKKGPQTKTSFTVDRTDYFKVLDQFGTYLNVAGMTCWEKLTAISGSAGTEEYTLTKTYSTAPSPFTSADNLFSDLLQMGRNTPAAEIEQSFYVGGWKVADYTLELWYMNTGDELQRN